MKKALVIAAHPDDELLGCGGIMSRFSKSIDFKVVFIAEGTTCRFDSSDQEKYAKEIQIRNDSACRALSRVRVSNIVFNNLPCGRLDQVPQLTINKMIEKEIQDFKPDTVFTHWSSDSNTDHRKVHDATMIATRPGMSTVKRVLCYEVLSSTEWGFKDSFCPNMFYNLSEEDVQNKCLAIKEYFTECRPWPFPRSDEGIKTLSMSRGMQSGYKYAEAFQIVRMCK